MNELQTQTTQLPETLPELARFALIGREKLVAVKAEIRAIDKVGLAKEVREQKLKEGQDIADAVLDAEVRIGELMAKVPKNQVGRPSKNIDTDVENLPTKSEVIQEAGFTPKQVERFQTLAKNPDIVEEAKAEARRNDDIVSRSAVLKKITDQKLKPLREEKNRELREAKKRHEEYVDTKTETIVSFADASQDKRDMHILSAEFISRLSKILMDISALGVNSKTEQEIDDLVSGDFDPGLTRTGLLIAERSLSSIRSAVERRL